MGADLTGTVYAPPRAGSPWRLADAVGHERLRVYSLARWALADAVRLLGAKRVLVPVFICREVLAGVRAGGAEPVLYPVGRDLKPGALPDGDAALAVNYFGFPQELEAFAGLPVIEDNAHGLFSRGLGTRTALGVFSQRKTVPLADGGALAVNDESLWTKAPPQLPAAESPRPELAFLRRRRALRAVSPLLGARGTLAAIRAIRRLKPEPAASNPDAERLMPFGPEPSTEALAPIDAVDAAAEVARRRELYALCARALRGFEPVFPALPEGCCPYGYPFRARGDEAEARLAELGLSSLPWPDLPEGAEAPGYLRDVRLVHFLW